MRVWLVDDQSAEKLGTLGSLLRQIQEQSGAALQLLGACPYQPDFSSAMGKLLPDLLDLLVIREAAWPAQADLLGVLGMGAGVLLVCGPERAERYRALAEQFPLWFVAESAEVDDLRLALLGTLCGRRRHAHLRQQLARLQQRLDDRIIVERAKGILVHRLHISEEEAYQRLRIQSRRQRRQIRDIAQSLLDTQSLMEPLPSDNGDLPVGEEVEPRQAEQLPPLP